MKRIVALFVIFSMLFSVVSAFSQEQDTGSANVALGKAATATDQYSDGYAPKYVVDGDVNTIYHNGSQEIGDKINGKSALVVDLGAVYNLTRITVKSRRDLDQAPMRAGWIVEVSSVPTFKDGVIVGEKPNPGEMGSDLSVAFKEPVIARYISVRSKNDFFCISEVEAYGERYAGKVTPVFGDVSENNYNATQLLYNLGIMEGISGTEFGVDMLMRREEAAKIATLSGNITPSMNNVSYFEDVSAENFYLAYINACVEKGIISKAALYRPRDYVKGAEFIKMLLSAMGYGEILKVYGTYPQNVMELAENLKLLNGVTIIANEPICRGDGAAIIYNALLSPVSAIKEALEIKEDLKIYYTEGESFLKRSYGLELKKGIVGENDLTSLYEENSSSLNSVKINDVKYYDESESLRGFIGQAVYYVSDEEGNIKSGWENKKTNEVYTLYTKDIVFDKTTKNEIVISDADGKTEEYDLADKLCVLKNGVAYNDYKTDRLNIANGTLKLIDNNGDGTIDVLHIYEPVVIVADIVKGSENQAFISGLNNSEINISDYRSLNTTYKGRPTDINEIARGNLVYAYISENEKNISLEVIRNSVSGTVTSIESNGFSVNGEKYGFSEYYLGNQGKSNDLYVGMEATFILDDFDELVWIEDISFGKSGSVLGYMQAVYIPTDLSNPKVKIFNEKSQHLTLEFAERAIIDGKTYSQNDLKEYLSSNKSDFVGKFTMYNTNAEGKINSLDTEKYVPAAETNSKLIDMEIAFADGARRVPDGIYSDHTMVVPILSNFPMFVIPTDTNGIPLLGNDYEPFYSVSQVNSKIPNGQIKISGETRFYGADEFGSPTFGVNLFMIDESLSSIGVIKDVYADAFVVASVMEGINNSGENCYVLTGFDLAEKRKKTVNINHRITNVIDSYKIYADLEDDTLAEEEKPNSSWFDVFRLIKAETDLTGIDKYLSDINTLGYGDVIRIEYSGAELSSVERVFKNDSSADYGITYSAGDQYMNISSTFRIYHAGFKSYRKGMLTVKTSGNATEIINSTNVTGGFYVCAPNRILKVEPKDFSSYCGENTRISVITKQGKNHSVIAYQE